MQEVIVYRNPLEAAVWHSLSSNGEIIFPMIAGVVVFCVVFAVAQNMLSRIYGSWGRTGTITGYASLAAGAVAGVATTWYLFI